MRRESAFRPGVSSAADARGLMQLIPPTAEQIARRLGDAVPAPDALYGPEMNIRFGTWYLSQLQARFGHPALTAAAYNAGPTAVLGWLKESGSLPLDMFVELIPYKETRGYVKQVVTDLHLYQALYGGSGKQVPSLTLPAPKDDGVTF
jgi:soluble lytic murein transglycosylase